MTKIRRGSTQRPEAQSTLDEAYWQANGTCCCKWECPHLTQATSKELPANLSCSRPLWIGPEVLFAVHTPVCNTEKLRHGTRKSEQWSIFVAGFNKKEYSDVGIDLNMAYNEFLSQNQGLPPADREWWHVTKHLEITCEYVMYKLKQDMGYDDAPPHRSNRMMMAQMRRQRNYPSQGGGGGITNTLMNMAMDKGENKVPPLMQGFPEFTRDWDNMDDGGRNRPWHARLLHRQRRCVLDFEKLLPRMLNEDDSKNIRIGHVTGMFFSFKNKFSLTDEERLLVDESIEIARTAMKNEKPANCPELIDAAQQVYEVMQRFLPYTAKEKKQPLFHEGIAESMTETLKRAMKAYKRLGAGKDPEDESEDEENDTAKREKEDNAEPVAKEEKDAEAPKDENEKVESPKEGNKEEEETKPEVSEDAVVTPKKEDEPNPETNEAEMKENDNAENKSEGTDIKEEPVAEVKAKEENAEENATPGDQDKDTGDAVAAPEDVHTDADMESEPEDLPLPVINTFALGTTYVPEPEPEPEPETKDEHDVSEGTAEDKKEENGEPKKEESATCKETADAATDQVLKSDTKADSGDSQVDMQLSSGKPTSGDNVVSSETKNEMETDSNDIQKESVEATKEEKQMDSHMGLSETDTNGIDSTVNGSPTPNTENPDTAMETDTPQDLKAKSDEITIAQDSA